MFNVHYKDIKQIKKNTGLADTYFVSKFGFSPYQACGHSCKYCDGRSEKYYVEGDFEKDILVRQNIAEILDLSLGKFRERGIVGISSGISDPYQPVEYKEKLMIKCAEKLIKHKYPAMLFTKSNMVLRDIDLWEELHHKAGFTLMMSIVYPNDKDRKILEPYASSVDQRLKTLKAFKDRGISVGVLSMPIPPFITDSHEALSQMARQYQEIGVDVVMPGTMTLRPGVNKNTYFDIIEKHYPHLLKKYQNLYSENKQSGSPKKHYAKQIHERYHQIINQHNLPVYIPHKLYKNRMPVYDEIYILLSHMIGLYDYKGINVDKLAIAKRRYGKWLMARKQYYNRRRNLGFNELESLVMNMLLNGEMLALIENEKLVKFLFEIVINQKTFNYTTLKVEA